MANITLKEIEHLAHLTRLELTEEQKQSLLGDMESILWLISKLEEVDVSDVETDWFSHIHHHMRPRTWVHTCEDVQAMMKNVTHPLQDNAIQVKSAIKE